MNPSDLKIRQFRYNADNLAYLAHTDTEAVAIDGGAVTAILDTLAAEHLELRAVINTHGHADHTPGNQALLSATNARLVDGPTLLNDGGITIGSAQLEAFATPGHTMDSITFHHNGRLITGDTLFNGTVGNCFSGDLDAFFDSIKKLMAFPDETIIYAGHDYITESLSFARLIDPENTTAIDAYAKTYNPDHVFSTLTRERAVNPYLRFNAPFFVNVFKQKHLPYQSERERWHSIMQLG